MAIINQNALAFNGTEIRSFAEAVIEDLYTYPALNQYMTVVGNVKAKQQIGLIGHLHKITRLDPGCGQGQYTPTVPMSNKFWNPVDLKIWLNVCWKDFLNTFMVYYEQVKTQKPDLTATEIFSDWLVGEVDNAAKEDIIRIAWFADTAIANGNLVNGAADVPNYNQIDGLWKQIFAIAAANPAQRVTISQNAATTKSGQAFSTSDVTNQTATGYFQNLIFNSDTRLRNNPNTIILSTRSLTDQYMRERMAFQNIEMSYQRLETGILTLTIMGVPVYVVDQWDRTIEGDFLNTGTGQSAAFFAPHRALLTVKANIRVGIDGPEGNDFTNWDIWYERKDETSNIKGLYKMDAKVIEDYMIQVAY